MKTNKFNPIIIMSIAGIFTLGMTNVCFALSKDAKTEYYKEKAAKYQEKVDEINNSGKTDFQKKAAIDAAYKNQLEHVPQGAAHPLPSTVTSTYSSTGKSMSAITGKKATASSTKKKSTAPHTRRK